jgi:hypothetical protein
VDCLVENGKTVTPDGYGDDDEVGAVDPSKSKGESGLEATRPSVRLDSDSVGKVAGLEDGEVVQDWLIRKSPVRSHPTK